MKEALFEEKKRAVVLTEERENYIDHLYLNWGKCTIPQNRKKLKKRTQNKYSSRINLMQMGRKQESEVLMAADWAGDMYSFKFFFPSIVNINHYDFCHNIENQM